MDAQQFVAEFGHIANSPGGVSRLRELIIQLAISGRLVERIESESTASQVIEEAAKLRRAYEEELELRVTRMHPLMDSRPFPVPDHWQWTHLEQLCLYIQRGKGPKYVDKSSTHVISQKCIQWAGFDLSSARFVSDDLLDSYGKERFLCEGDLLWNSTGTGTAGRVAIYRADEGIKAVADSHVTVVRLANCSPRYLWCVIASPWVQSRIEPSHPDSLVSGTTQQVELNTSTARALPIPLPPIEEQSRIVAKVDELMALCDKLESQQQARRKLQNALRQSTLQAVASATSPHELQVTWARLAYNFGRLFHVPEDVEDLRKTVLDLAVSGYLSNPDALDEPSSTLKAKILAAKERGIADGTFPRKKHVKPEVLEETTLPAHWETITLDEAISTIDAGWSPACLPNARDDANKWGVLKTTAVQVLRFLPHEHKELPASLDPRPQYQIEVGDILITRAGPKNRVGICCVVDAAPPRLMISDKLIRFHIVDDLINPRFVALCLSAGEPGRIVERLKSGMADSQMNISQDKLRSITIPLPPIEEQQRILAKIKAFMTVVDSYSERLRRKNNLAEQVAAASVSALTGIAIEQEEEPMKAPQTELIAPLRLGTAPDIKAQAPLATILARHNGEMSAKDLWQRVGGEIDAFYAQLKTEVAYGWILEPARAEMREKPADTVSA
ncbi:restriction endonuclease subunit S [Methylobacillus sp. Pita2]|uniref:restriction endonuclease subunit S n=1 Tax=Methylobacillus sp. Pita2 TaxID=3383245 RepID=UPI0038B4F823